MRCRAIESAVLSAGMNDYITKPLEAVTDLARVLEVEQTASADSRNVGGPLRSRTSSINVRSQDRNSREPRRSGLVTRAQHQGDSGHEKTL
jgi:DNA-binding response OmpR family regulator